MLAAQKQVPGGQPILLDQGDRHQCVHRRRRVREHRRAHQVVLEDGHVQRGGKVAEHFDGHDGHVDGGRQGRLQLIYDAGIIGK